jgi:phage shock protein PspC (stress-responsive transcriptional regulator)
MVATRAASDHWRMESNVTPIKRSRDDRMLGGVCGGIAKHLNIDPVIVRIATIALVCAVGAGAVAYVAAWVLMPLDDGPAAAAPADAREPVPA